MTDTTVTNGIGLSDNPAALAALRSAFRLRPAFHRIRRTFEVLAVAAGSMASAWAQGCPFCYNAAAATRAGGLAALRNGILILMIPPVLIVGLVCLMGIRRYRNDRAAEIDFDRAGSGDFEHDLPVAEGHLEGGPLLSGVPGATR